MISVIICSTEPIISQKLIDNINQTIGLNYELLVIPNQNNNYSIFEAYNIGLNQSKFDICCFMHQDIIFHTKEWGQKVIKHFENNQIGLIGIAGTRLLGRIPAFWSDFTDNNIINIIQSDNTGKISTQNMFSNLDFCHHSIEVVAIDGVWFCLNKEKCKGVQFDNRYTGFHFYDLDICMQVQTSGKKIHVVNNIIIEHFSWGSINKIWVKNAFIFYNKWRSFLPFVIPNSKLLENKEEINSYVRLIKIVDYYKYYNNICELLGYGLLLFNVRIVKILYRYKRVFLRGIVLLIKSKFSIRNKSTNNLKY
jgi:GT2 family glycosyltransferase